MDIGPDHPPALVRSVYSISPGPVSITACIGWLMGFGTPLASSGAGIWTTSSLDFLLSLRFCQDKVTVRLQWPIPTIPNAQLTVAELGYPMGLMVVETSPKQVPVGDPVPATRRFWAATKSDEDTAFAVAGTMMEGARATVVAAASAPTETKGRRFFAG